MIEIQVPRGKGKNEGRRGKKVIKKEGRVGRRVIKVEKHGGKKRGRN